MGECDQKTVESILDYYYESVSVSSSAVSSSEPYSHMVTGRYVPKKHQCIMGMLAFMFHVHRVDGQSFPMVTLIFTARVKIIDLQARQLH